MSEYIGKRIIPRHDGVWDKSKSYESLVIVLDGNGDSYMSRRAVPAGTALTNTEYWAQCHSFSAQLKQAEGNMESAVEEMKKDNADTIDAVNKTCSDTVAAVNKTAQENITAINKTCSDTVSAVTEQTDEVIADSESIQKNIIERMDNIEARQDANVSASTDSDADYAAEVVDARVDSEGNTHDSIGAVIRSIGTEIKEACAENPEGAERDTLASYIEREWRTDYNLMRTSAIHKGHVNLDDITKGDMISDYIDLDGEGYYLVVNAAWAKEQGYCVHISGDFGGWMDVAMVGWNGGHESDQLIGGKLALPNSVHSFDVADGIVVKTAATTWNATVAKYLYINLAEELRASLTFSFCNSEGEDVENCLTELENLEQGYLEQKISYGVTKTVADMLEATVQESVESAVSEASQDIITQAGEIAESKAEEATGTLRSFWKGCKANFMGDSITYGLYTPVGGSSPSIRADERFCEIAGSLLSMDTVRNYGVSGTSISSTSTQSPASAFTQRYSKMDDDADLICIVGGTNDYGTAVELGTSSDTTDISFYGALHVLCEGLAAKYVGKRVVFITPFHRASEGANSAGYALADYRQAIFDVARDRFGFAVIDGWSLGLIARSSSYRSSYIVDGLHPNPEGHELLGKSLARALNSL